MIRGWMRQAWLIQTGGEDGDDPNNVGSSLTRTECQGNRGLNDKIHGVWEEEKEKDGRTNDGVQVFQNCNAAKERF